MREIFRIPYFCLLTVLGIGGVNHAYPQTLSTQQLKPYVPSQLRTENDWLLQSCNQKTSIFRTSDGNLAFSNGLITRIFSLRPNGATIALDNLITRESLLRAVGPEAILWINGREIKVGGLTGQPVENYLSKKWTDSLRADPLSMKLVSYSTNPTRERFEWKRHSGWMAQTLPWPAPGMELVFTYEADADSDPGFLSGIVVKVHYELYDGMPVLSKWVSIENNSGKRILINNIQSERLAFPEGEINADPGTVPLLGPLYAVSDFDFGGSMSAASSDHAVQWKKDSSYNTQRDFNLNTPCILSCMQERGMYQGLANGEKLESVRLWELLQDSKERERRTLACRKLFRTISPWAMENPIFMHVLYADDSSVKLAIDQCAEVGFEMVIMTFGSGLNIEDTSARNLGRIRDLETYARSKNIALGAYSLLASRSIDKADDVVMPSPQMHPVFGHSPCLQSEWGQSYFKKLYRFYTATGLDVLEHDGSYPGDICASESHPGHKNLDDSQWKQFAEIRDFYRWCRTKGIYLNIPDWYFFNGGNKTGMGYRETNWSLPREYQEIIERQNIYDGTWEKSPPMGWMFVPLTEYHGGGAAATIEPLKDHLPHYEQRLANLFGAGVQAAYRGPRLYDSPETKKIVKKWVDFYKEHRAVLDGDIIHIRRPDGRDYDAILHVDPMGQEKGLLMIYNPLDEKITREIWVDLYYTGLRGQARIRENEGPYHAIRLDGTKAKIKFEIAARSQLYFVFQ